MERLREVKQPMEVQEKVFENFYNYTCCLSDGLFSYLLLSLDIPITYTLMEFTHMAKTTFYGSQIDIPVEDYLLMFQVKSI